MARNDDTILYNPIESIFGAGTHADTSVNGQRPINNLSALMDLLVEQENGQNLEFRCSYIHLDPAKVGE